MELQSAGLDVEVGILDDETRLVIGPWLTALEQQRPFVTLVYAVHADGWVGGLQSAARSSLSQAARDAYDLRLVHDAVLSDDGRLEEGVLDWHGRDVSTSPPPNHRWKQVICWRRSLTVAYGRCSSMAVARSSAHFWKLDRLIKQLHMWKIVDPSAASR